MTASSHDVAVIGAGPAGLMAAWRAASAGLDVVVVERAPVVGGMAASIEVAGQRVDLGSHRLHPATAPHVLGAVRSLLGDDLQVRARNGRIAWGSRFVSFPLRAGDLVRNLPLRTALALAAESATAPLRRPRADTFAEVVRAGLGPTVLHEFYGPYARKLWGVDASELAGELARRRISAASPRAVAQRLLRARTPSAATFLSPRRGFGQISEALADATEKAGGVLQLGDAVSAIEVQPTEALLRLDGGTTISARVVLSTIPITVLARLTGIRADTTLDHRAMALVYLVVDRPRYTPFDAHYLPAPTTVVSRLSEPKNYRDGPDPADRTVLCAEVPCSVGDAVWTSDDRRLAAQVARELEALALPAIGEGGSKVVRLPHVYPVYLAGFDSELAEMERAIDGLARIVTFGRAGLFTPDNSHHAMDMGWQAAACLGPDGSFDRARWSRARVAFRDHVVED